MTTDLEFDNMADDLDDVGGLCGDEQGEWWTALAALWPMVKDHASNGFSEAYKQELMWEHKHFKETYQIVEEVKTEYVMKQRLQLREETK